MIELIALETASILILSIIMFGSQMYIAKILLKNVNMRITKLDSNLAEAISSVVESKMGQNFEAPNPLVSIFADIMKNKLNEHELPRDSDGKFKIIEEIK